MTGFAQAPLFSEEDGFRRKEASQARVAFSEPSWQDKAAAAIKRLAATGQVFTVDDLRAELAEEPKSPNSYGTAFTIAEKKGVICVAGMGHSKRPEAKGRRVIRWSAA